MIFFLNKQKIAIHEKKLALLPKSCETGVPSVLLPFQFYHKFQYIFCVILVQNTLKSFTN